MSHPRRQRGGHDEAHENHERWLITYSDMITLLMVLFIVMFSISQVDQHKFAMLKAGLASTPGTAPSILQAGTGIMQSTGTSPQRAIDLMDSPAILPAPMSATGAGTATSPETTTPDSASAALARQELASLKSVEAKIKQALAAHGLQSSVVFRVSSRGLIVSIVADDVLFAANLAALTDSGRRLLSDISPALRAVPNNLSIEGNTNQVPVKPLYFPTEWELSAARAVTVTRYLIDAQRLAPVRLSAVAHADQHPLLPPSDPRSTEVNRRVDIVVLSDLPPSSSALLPALAGSTETVTP
jgi:chemotaxis protein MotB